MESSDGPDRLQTATAIARAVRDAGGRALIVGGWSRDQLLGRPSKDIDIEVFGLDAADLKAVLSAFGTVNTVGESFTVYKVADLDVSLPRRESKVSPGHRGFAVTGDPHLTIREAARRRDFTINAIAFDPLTERLRRSLRRPRGPGGACPACGRSLDLQRRQPARAARRSVRGAF